MSADRLLCDPSTDSPQTVAMSRSMQPRDNLVSHRFDKRYGSRTLPQQTLCRAILVVQSHLCCTIVRTLYPDLFESNRGGTILNAPYSGPPVWMEPLQVELSTCTTEIDEAMPLHWNSCGLHRACVKQPTHTKANPPILLKTSGSLLPRNSRPPNVTPSHTQGERTTLLRPAQHIGLAKGVRPGRDR